MDIWQPRAPAFDNQLSACILNDGVFDVYESFVGKYRNTLAIAAMSGKNPVNVAVLTTMGLHHSARWSFAHMLWVFGVNTPFELVSKEYRIHS